MTMILKSEFKYAIFRFTHFLKISPKYTEDEHSILLLFVLHSLVYLLLQTYLYLLHPSHEDG